MKKLMMIAAAIMFIAPMAFAQEGQRRSPDERAKAQTARMTKDLGLNKEQAVRLEALNMDYVQQAEVMHKEREAQRSAMKQRGMALREAHNADMKAVLTAEQYAKWSEQQAALKEKRTKEHHQSPDRKGMRMQGMEQTK